MARVLKTPEARRDADDIWDHIAADNPDAADQLIRAFDDKLGRLARSPEAGRPRDELAAGLRSAVVGKYVLFFCPIEDGIELIRIIHGARDIPKLLRPS